MRIYTVGIGSAAGATLEVEGFTVHTQLDEAMLKQISQLTGGAYYNAESEQDLREIYDNLDHAAGDQAGKDGSHLDLCWRRRPGLADRRGFLAGLVQPLAVILDWLMKLMR